MENDPLSTSMTVYSLGGRFPQKSELLPSLQLSVGLHIIPETAPLPHPVLKCLSSFLNGDSIPALQRPFNQPEDPLPRLCPVPRYSGNFHGTCVCLTALWGSSPESESTYVQCGDPQYFQAPLRTLPKRLKPVCVHRTLTGTSQMPGI